MRYGRTKQQRGQLPQRASEKESRHIGHLRPPVSR